jgi:hypothetical protein
MSEPIYAANIGVSETWMMTGRLRWFTRLPEETPSGSALTILQAEWFCREAMGKTDWREIEHATSSGVAAQRELLAAMMSTTHPKDGAG